MWIMAGGNTSTIGEAKNIIGASLSGLVLVMVSYLLLTQVNPALTAFKPMAITPIKSDDHTVVVVTSKPTNATCSWKSGSDCFSSSTGIYGIMMDKSFCSSPEQQNTGCCCVFTPLSNCSYKSPCDAGEKIFTLDATQPTLSNDAITHCGSSTKTTNCCCGAGSNGTTGNF